MLNAICYFFSYFVEAVILWQYSFNLFIARRKPKMTITILSSLYLVLFTVSLFESKWLNMILYFLANFVFLITQFRLKFQSAFFHSAILTAAMGMCELMLYGTIKFFAPHFLDGNRDFYHLVIFVVFSKLIFFTVIYILIHLMKNQKECSQQHDKSSVLLVFIPITSVFVMFTFVSIGEASSLSSSQDWMITSGAILLLAANLLVFGINQYNQKKHMEFTEMQLLLQRESASAEYYEMLRLQNENQRILIHDIKRHLQSIDMLNEQKESEKITAYIRQLILSSDLKESARLCDHEMLNSILCRYMQQCNNLHIAFHVDIRSGTTDFIADSDLTALFCNLLDNALEAAGSVPDAYIEINTNKREKTPFVVMTVINSCRTNPFTVQSGKLDTSKTDKNRHGFGLKSIRKTISKYDGDIQMYYNTDTLTFHTIVTLKQHLCR